MKLLGVYDYTVILTYIGLLSSVYGMTQAIHGDYKMHLDCGMAFTVEPGIYIPNEIGIRIEDVVIINEQGETEILNKCTKELIEIKA